jgi:dienelactone hydrolase
MNLSAGERNTIVTVEDLWQGFDPGLLPLEIQTIQTWEEKEAAFQRLRFTGEQVPGGKVRVLAIQGAPREGKNLPGILHIHGGGQTASLDWVRFWARRGYVCTTFDFCGRWEKRTEFTDWGPLKHGNMAESGGGFQLKPTPRESSWFHWAVVSRRALTLLAGHPQVDPQRLGIFGVSVGGSLTWMIAGSDRRVKAAIPIYGCGYNYDRRNAHWGILVPNDDFNLFQRFMNTSKRARTKRLDLSSPSTPSVWATRWQCSYTPTSSAIPSSRAERAFCFPLK